LFLEKGTIIGKITAPILNTSMIVSEKTIQSSGKSPVRQNAAFCPLTLIIDAHVAIKAQNCLADPSGFWFRKRNLKIDRFDELHLVL
jgi:hypothetical protein